MHETAVLDALNKIAAQFRAHGIDNPIRQAEELLCDFLNCSRVSLYDPKSPYLTQKNLDTCLEWTNRRLQNEPLAYISGKVQFYDCSLMINPSVLIPRQETEILVDKVIEKLKTQELQETVLWDLCCGSGCIGIALKKRFPHLTVFLSDDSIEALDLAARNAQANGVDVTCVHGDLLIPFHGMKAHYVVSNPPYISADEYHTLEKGVKDFEPYSALVSGRTGLEFYKRLAEELPVHLHPGAHVWFEIGYQQGEAIQKLFQRPFWTRSHIENDWAGHNRFFFLEIE